MTKGEQDTREHIGKVRYHMAHIVANLFERANVHDLSKLEEPELSGFEELRARLADVEYGSDAYYLALRSARDTIVRHYTHNAHHPEHWPNGVDGMSLLDIIEMLADWKAAGERTKDGSMAKSLEVNFARFEIGKQLQSILINTARELGWL